MWTAGEKSNYAHQAAASDIVKRANMTQ
jgi:hypothetical protein